MHAHIHVHVWEDTSKKANQNYRIIGYLNTIILLKKLSNT